MVYSKTNRSYSNKRKIKKKKERKKKHVSIDHEYQAKRTLTVYSFLTDYRVAFFIRPFAVVVPFFFFYSKRRRECIAAKCNHSKNSSI
jgi:hypothetical protein